MSTVVTKNVQIGNSGTASQNLTWYQPSTPDGTIRLGVGNSGATSSDAVVVSSAGITQEGGYPSFACRAWVNFNSVGTVTIRGSGNVSSITDNNVGNFYINLTTALQDTNYSVVGCVSTMSGGYPGAVQMNAQAPTTTRIQIETKKTNDGGTSDSDYNLIAVFR